MAASLIHFNGNRGPMATTHSMSQGDPPIYVLIGNEMEPWVKIRGTARGSIRYYAVVRPTLESQYVGHEGVVGSVCDDGNASNRPDVAVVRVEVINFTATTRPEGAAQGGHVGERQHRLIGAT
ncbi:hypothetical protein GOBAR_AA29050 [Gossypium barbadense]|uniref:Uncharacterized protein n=1 Tax=Gossypium barbadense TaxID=3634 RepID=A0A2P5WKN4_GOSBA|nr:hypothetical protein GOBAR_AA29050 [Gossypium barbadense]